jgi:hypothetical protein
MNKKIIILFFLLYAAVAPAQVRVGVAAGPGFSLKGNGNDSSFFGRKYMNRQLRLGWQKGRLGIVFTGGLVTQDAGHATIDERLSVPPFETCYFFNGGTVKNTFFTIGPEVCFPMGPIKTQFHISAGMGRLKAPATGITRADIITSQQLPIYQNKLDKKTTGIFKTGFNLNYYIGNKIAFLLIFDYLSYSIRYKNTDNRYAANNNNKVTEQKQVAGISGGLTFKL